MVNYKTLQTTLISNLFNCGFADAEYLLNTVNDIENYKFTICGEQEYLFDVSDEGNFLDKVFETIKDLGGDEHNFENVLFYIYQLLIERLNTIYELSKYGDDLTYYINLSINGVATTIMIDESFSDCEIPEDIKTEIKAIIDNF